MPFHPQILDDLAVTGANIVIDTATATASPREIVAVVNLWLKSSGSVTIKNAGSLSASDVVTIAKTLRNRVTLEE